MKNQEELVKKVLQIDEEIIWSGHSYRKNFFYKYRYIFIILGISIFYLGIHIGQTSDQKGIAIFMCIMGFFMAVSSLKETKESYVLSNQRIFIIINKKIRSKYQLNKLYHVRKESGILNGKPYINFYHHQYYSNDENGPTAQILPEGNFKEIYETIYSTWIENSPYEYYFNKPLKAYAEKIGFSFSPFNSSRSSIHMRGVYKGVPISFSLSSKEQIRNVSIKAECKNTQDLYFSIRAESSGDNISKFMGLQDIKIGDPNFDKRFILQSNHLDFLEHILVQKVKNKISKSFIFLKGSIHFGTKQDLPNEKQKPKIEEVNILDDHLLGELPDEMKHIEGHTSTLTYRNDHLHNSQNLNLISKNIISNFELFLMIIDRIDSFYNAKLSDNRL